MATYGRSRQSITGIEEGLRNLFLDHPLSHTNDAGEPVIPGDALVDILNSFSQMNDDVQIMSKEEEDQIVQFLVNNPGLEATPKVMLEFLAVRAKKSQDATDAGGFAAVLVNSDGDSSDDSPQERGRQEERGFYDDNSRSSSTDSVGTSVYKTPSRPPSRGAGESPFDASKRQRATPLINAAPSSWPKRPMPAHRRKSDAGTQGYPLSDSESTVITPSAWGRRGSRSRAPSNPTSPTSYSQSISSSALFSPVNSPSPRPHSRNHSYPQSQFSINSLHDSPPLSGDNSIDEASFLSSININSLPMPLASSDSDSDSDVEQPSILGYERSLASSTASLEPTERMEALQRINTDLAKKLMEAEKTLQNRLTEHEIELEEMESKLEELKSELGATKKEEKELRGKEKLNSTQISSLESEIAKLLKSLDNARSSYQSLNKQYQEQCAESERYRTTLRHQDEELKEYKDAAALHVLESQKWSQEQANLEARVAQLEQDVLLAQQTYAQLDEQKQENLLLKETIDRMRFEMDEMRNSAANSLQQGGGPGGSGKGSLSRNFHAELLRARTGSTDAPVEQDVGGEAEVQLDDDEVESEDYIQTIITKTRKRKIPGRPSLATFQLEETIKEYADAASQYEDAFHRPATIQTDPELVIPRKSHSTQTDKAPVRTFLIQTDPEPVPIPKVLIEMEIQTDEVELEAESVTMTQEDEETSASSSSTLLPPTPRAQSEDPLDPQHTHDLPPTYNQVTDHDRDELALKVANETLKQWHKGANLPIQPLRSGVSLDAIEEWKSLKEELGVECTVIDKIMEESQKTGQPRASASSNSALSLRSSRSSRFYNIYNTYVYGGGDSSALIANMLLCAGASALAVLFMAPSQYVIPGGPTFYDRTAWSSFNTMYANSEGFSDGTYAAGSLLSRLFGDAARIVQGWPT